MAIVHGYSGYKHNYACRSIPHLVVIIM